MPKKLIAVQIKDKCRVRTQIKDLSSKRSEEINYLKVEDSQEDNQISEVASSTQIKDKCSKRGEEVKVLEVSSEDNQVSSTKIKCKCSKDLRCMH